MVLDRYEKEKAEKAEKAEKSIATTVQQKRNKSTMEAEKKQFELKWAKWDKENVVDFTNSNYTWTDFIEFLKLKTFADEFEAEKFIAEYSRKCIVAVNENFYIKYDNDEQIYQCESKTNIKLNMIFVSFYTNQLQQNKRLSDYTYLFRSCSTVYDSPTQKQNVDALNIWGRPQAKLHEHPDMSKVQPWLNFIKNIWASGDEKVYKWLLKWFKITCTMSDKKTSKAIFVFGKKAGDSAATLVNFIKMILGRKMSTELNGIQQLIEHQKSANSSHKFVAVNNVLENRNELKNNFQLLKSYITNKDCAASQEQKNTENFANFIFISNNENITHLSNKTYMVIEISPQLSPENIAIARTFCSENLNQNAADNFYSYLMNKDLSDINIDEVPLTDARIHSIEYYKSDLEAFLTEMQEEFNESLDNFIDGRIIVRHKTKTQEEKKEQEAQIEKTFWVKASWLYERYTNWCEVNKIKNTTPIRMFYNKVADIFRKDKVCGKIIVHDLTLFNKNTDIRV